MEYLSDILALLALLLSGYATFKAIKFKKSEKELVEIQKKLNQLMLEKEEREAEEASKADLSTNFVNYGIRNHRLKVYNRGKSTAYNVQIEFPDGNDIVIEGDIKDKFPLEKLERGHSVNLIAGIHAQSKNKLTVKLLWEDEVGQVYKSISYPTI